MSKQIRRWLSAIGIAKVLFEVEGYHCIYLEEIEKFIKEVKGVQSKNKRRVNYLSLPIGKASGDSNDKTG